MDYTEKVLKLLVEKFDWNLNTSLTSTGRKLVSDTIKALDIIKENESKLHQPTVSGRSKQLLAFAEWYNNNKIIKPRSLILKDDVLVFLSQQ